VRRDAGDANATTRTSAAIIGTHARLPGVDAIVDRPASTA